jgi:hypothetical protein
MSIARIRTWMAGVIPIESGGLVPVSKFIHRGGFYAWFQIAGARKFYKKVLNYI